MRFQDQRIAILGGTSGLGLATAKAAAAEDAAVVVASATAARVEGALAQLPDSAEGHVVDLLDEDAVRDFFAAVGALDHLAFTAGESLQLGLVAETPVDDARRALDLRIWGAYTAVKHGAPRLREGGSIVLTSGSAGLDQIKLADAGIVSPARGGSADDSKAWLPSDVRVSPGRSQVRHVRHASVRAQC
jgi:NAD(P)-dependent dehydrogenase (short-subunit alcohol dehydrogenase family)